MIQRDFVRMNAETGEMLHRELSPAEVEAQDAWAVEQEARRQDLHKHYKPTNWAKDDTPAEWRRFLDGLDFDARCDKCQMLLPKSGRCDCTD